MSSEDWNRPQWDLADYRPPPSPPPPTPLQFKDMVVFNITIGPAIGTLLIILISHCDSVYEKGEDNFLIVTMNTYILLD